MRVRRPAAELPSRAGTAALARRALVLRRRTTWGADAWHGLSRLARESLVAYPEFQSRVVQGQDATLWKLSSWFESTPGSHLDHDALTGG